MPEEFPPYTVVEDDPPPYGVDSSTVFFGEWDEGDPAQITFVQKDRRAFILGMQSSPSVRGRLMLRTFRERIVPGAKVVVLNPAPDVVLFWEKMQDEGLIDATDEREPEEFFAVGESAQGVVDCLLDS